MPIMDMHQLRDTVQFQGYSNVGGKVHLRMDSRMVVKNGFLEEVMLETNSQWCTGVN